MLCLAAFSSADNAAARSADLLQARRANLQSELANLQQEQQASTQQFNQVLATGDAAAINRINTARMERQKRIDEINKQLEQLSARTSSALTTPTRLAAASAAPSWKQNSAESKVGSYSSAPTAPAPAIMALDEAEAKLRRVNDSGVSSSTMSRRRRPAISEPVVAIPVSSVPAAAVTVQSDPASVAARREIAGHLKQRQEIGREQDAIQREMARAQRDASMATRTGQYEQAAAAEAKANQLNQQYQAAARESARLDQKAQFIASELAQPAPDQNVGRRAGDVGLRELGGTTALTADDGTFRSGDELLLSVAEDNSLNGIYAVAERGVPIPNAGRVPVVGMTDVQAEEAIKAKLEATLLRVATVTVERRAKIGKPPEPQPGETPVQRFDVIYLAGEFITPGPLRIPPTVVPTLLQTIIRSGGITPSGDLTRVKLLRVLEGGEGHVEEINVAAVLTGEVRPSDIILYDGDIIVIPPFAPVVYVTGNVESPGTLRLFQDETLTAYAAILRAGGFARFANIRKVYVVRDLGNGEKAHIPVNIRDVQKGKAPDVILQGKDIVVVPERFFSF